MTLSLEASMPDKRLGFNALRDDETGSFCTLGVLGNQRGMDLDEIDPEEPGSQPIEKK